jgi:hypothetical protein
LQGLPKLSQQVVDLTCDDDGDCEGGQVSWLRTISSGSTSREANFTIRDRLYWVSDQLRSPPAVLSAKVTGIHRRRPYSVIDNGHTFAGKKSPWINIPG